MRPTSLALPTALSLAALLLASRPEPARAGACAGPMASLSLLTPASDRVPVGQGLLVAAQATGRWLGSVSGAGLREPQLEARLEREGESIALRSEALAPGLLRLVPLHAPAPGAWTLRTESASEPVTFVAREAPARLPPPQLTAVWRQDPSSLAEGTIGVGPRRGGGGRPQPRMGVELARARPAGALAIVLLVGERPFVAAQISTASRSLVVYSPRSGRCAPVTFGSVVAVGTPVRAAYVDALGRLSDPSDELAVTAR